MKFVSGETILTNVFVVIQILRSIDAVILNFEYISLVSIFNVSVSRETNRECDPFHVKHKLR